MNLKKKMCLSPFLLLFFFFNFKNDLICQLYIFLILLALRTISVLCRVCMYLYTLCGDIDINLE